MANAPFPISPYLTQIALAYSNPALIADLVMPRTTVGKQEFKYYIYTTEERFTIPSTLVGRKSRPNEVEFGMTEATASTQDYGLEDPIPNADIENAPKGYNPKEHAVAAIEDLIALDREKRVADLLFTSANYGANTASPATKWNAASGSTPIDDILTALDAPLMRPNALIFGQQSWRSLSTNADINKAVHGNSGDSGIATRQQVAALFEVQEVLVGLGRANTARKGQTASLTRVWGDNVACLYRNPSATPRGGVTFGLTFQWGGKIASEFPDKNIGMRGGVRVRSGESVVEKIIAPDAGYLLTNVSA